MTGSAVAERTAKTQMSGRYPLTLAEDAHRYAVAHELSLNAVLSMALAEYLAKRRESAALPAPQLHYRKGHPPAELVRLQQELMQRDPRGRKLTERCSRVASPRHEVTRAHAVTTLLAHPGAGRDPRQQAPLGGAAHTATHPALSTIATAKEGGHRVAPA